MYIRLSLAILICAVFIVGDLPAACAGENEPVGGWTNEVVGSLNLTQAGFDNWAQGGENTLGWQTSLGGKFVSTGTGHEWVNAIKLAYGMTKVGDEDARKSVDEIRIESVFTYKAGFYVDPYVATTAETQFSTGHEYTDSSRTAISDFLDPGYFTQSTGIGRVFNDVIRSRLGASIKETVTDKYPVPYADDPDTPDEIEDIKVEVGAESVTDLSLKISDDLTFDSKLELFSNLKATNEIDVRWDNLLTAKIEEYLSVTLNVKVFYDSDISRSRQIKEALAIGLTYRLM
ncbi:MAG: DUF3078 domain-containing protein [Candidatus Eisenbacteria bacterium]